MKPRVLLTAIAAAGVLCLCASCAIAGQVFTFWAEQDSWVNESNPGANYGNSTYMSVKDRSGLSEAYIRFSDKDIASLSGISIKSASLFTYQYQGTNSPGDLVAVHKVLSDWGENVITWNDKPSYDSNALGSINIGGETNTSGWREWPGIEAVLASWSDGGNFGLALENNGDNVKEELFSRLYSSEYSNSALRPYLKVTAAPEPVSMALFGLGGAVIGVKRMWKRRL